MAVVSTTACVTIDVNHGPPLDQDSHWVILPVVNVSETPQASERVEAILTTLVRGLAIQKVHIYDPEITPDAPPMLDDRQRFQAGLLWARERGYVYGVTGTVVEWRYKSGLDAEPAIGVTVRVIDVKTGEVVWSCSGAKAGWGQDTLGGVAQDLLRDVVHKIHFSRPMP